MKDRQYVCSELKEEGTSMAFRDLGAWLKGLLNGGQGNSSRRPDGGTSCYRPIQRRNRQEEELAREKAAEYAAGQPRVASLHTGFTGMNPPPSGPMPVQNTQSGYPGFAGDNGNSGNPGYYGQVGFSGNPGFAGNDSRNFGGNGSANVPGGNISYMPGVYGQDAGSTCTHVEHIMTITSLRSCYDAIECMKNEETLIVTLDVLGSDSEKIILLQRDITKMVSETFGSYLYYEGIMGGNFDYTTAAGLFQNVVNLILLSVFNWIARRLGDTALW